MSVRASKNSRRTSFRSAENALAFPSGAVMAESVDIQNPEFSPLPLDQQENHLRSRGLLFSDTVLRETQALGNREREFATREKVLGVVLSIDDDSVRDLDNALSYRPGKDGTHVLGVHAADVAAWIRLGSALDFSARTRKHTRYPGEEGLLLPMLPLSLSHGKLSLFEGQRRLTKSVELVFSNEGKLLSSRIFNSQLVNQHRISEKTAALARNGGGRGAQYPELADALRAMSEIASKNMGASSNHQNLGMGKMLTHLTVMSAKEVAKTLKDAGLEASFRNQPATKEKFSYGATPQGHASLDTEAYATWTGPMRRYADLDVQRSIDRFLKKQKPSGRKQALDSKLRKAQLRRLNGPTRKLKALVKAMRNK